MAIVDGHNYNIFYDDIDLYTTYGLVAVTQKQHEAQDFGISAVNLYDVTNTVLIKQVLDKTIIEITFVKVNNNKVDKLTVNDKASFSQLFFRTDKEVHTLVVGDVCYYVTPVSATLNDLKDSSYFTIIFEVISNTGLSRLINNSYNFLPSATNKIEITNKGLDEEYLELEIEATDTTTITIRGNDLVGNIILNAGKNIIDAENNELINCDFIGVVSMVNLRELLKLKIGHNQFTITTSKAINVKTSYQETLGVV